MKKLILIIILFLTFSSICRGEFEWTLIVKSKQGDSFYIDLNVIEKKRNYVYFWQLNDYVKPTPGGYLSNIEYVLGDCKLIKDRVLKQYFSKTPMAGRIVAKYEKPHEWNESHGPNSITGMILSVVCNH